MKKLLLSLMIVVAYFSVNAQQKHIIKTNPFTLAIGSFNVSYEKVLDSKSSIIISGTYIYKLFGKEINAGGFGVAYRYYFTHAKKEVPSGFYVNPEFVTYFSNDNSLLFGIGAELGYQWAWESGFALDLGIGPMYRAVMETNTHEVFSTGGVTPTITIAIGYAF